MAPLNRATRRRNRGHATGIETDRKFACKGLGRVHRIIPGDYYECVVCNKLTHSTGHQYHTCPNTAVVEKINRACRLAYVYLLQRHVDHPKAWNHPGDFRLYHPGFISDILELVSAETILDQPDDWSILEPIVYTAANGQTKEQKYFMEYLYQVMTDNLPEEEELTEGYLAHYYVPALNTTTPLGTWDLDHETHSSKLTLSKEKQIKMETGRNVILGKFVGDAQNRHLLPLLCTTRASYIGVDSDKTTGFFPFDKTADLFPYLKNKRVPITKKAKTV
jgi:hypothetical protein